MAEWWKGLLEKQENMNSNTAVKSILINKKPVKANMHYRYILPKGSRVPRVSVANDTVDLDSKQIKRVAMSSLIKPTKASSILTSTIGQQASVSVANKTQIVVERTKKVINQNEDDLDQQNAIHCRLCDKNIGDGCLNMLYNHDEQSETKLGRKINIILNSGESFTELSNYCCDVCAMKVQVCFSLLVEIQASDEVIRQTYQHLSKESEVNTSIQKFLCEECNSTVTGIKSFIRHYESHILKKTIVGLKGEIKITEIVPIKETNQDGLSDVVFSVENGTDHELMNEDSMENTDALENDNETENSKETDTGEAEVEDVKEEISYLVENDNETKMETELTNNMSDTNIMVNENEEEEDEEEEEEEEEEDEENENTFNVNDNFELEDIRDSTGENTNDIDSDGEGSTQSDKSYQHLVNVIRFELGKSDNEEDLSAEFLTEVKQTEEGEFVCETCNISFPYKFLIVRHLQQNHKDFDEEEKSVEVLLTSCRYCKDSFSAKDFRRHISECKNEFFQNSRKVLCHICGKAYESKQWLNHTRKHEAAPHPDGWPCDICGKKFKAKRFLKSHLGEHDESKKKICEICGKKLLPLSLFSHMLKHKEKKHVCSYCGKGFTYSYSLRIHLKVHEGGSRVEDTRFAKKKDKLHCWICKEECDSMYALNKHLKLEHKSEHIDSDSRFPCSECDKKFSDMFSLKAHLKLIHEMKDEDIARFRSLPVYRCIECNVCGKVFNSENKVRIHMKHDHGLKPFEMEVLKKECEKCGKKFASKQNLIHHINGAHLHIKPMSCDICHEKFAKHSSLIYHKLRHSGEKPFQCEFCKKSYRQRNDVIRHLARHVRDNELELEEASAINTSPSPLVIKRRIFLKDSSINYQSVVKKSRRSKSEPVQVDAVMEESTNVTEYKQEEEEFPESMIYIEEVVTDELPAEDTGDFQFMTIKPVYNEERNTIILSSPSEVKNVTYRCIPSQLKHMPAVIVKKQEQI